MNQVHCECGAVAIPQWDLDAGKRTGYTCPECGPLTHDQIVGKPTAYWNVHVKVNRYSPWDILETACPDADVLATVATLLHEQGFHEITITREA